MHGARRSIDLGGGRRRRGLHHANLAGKACSVTGCRPAHCAMQPRRQSLLGHGLSPYKKAKKQIFLRERAPDKICFYLFCMACSFREKSACIMEKGMVD